MNKEEIKHLLECLYASIPTDYVRSCDTSDGIGYFEEDTESWQYRLHKRIVELQQENEKLNHYKLLYQKVKERIDKAIEYTKKHSEDAGYLDVREVKGLLEILKGENNE